MPSKKTFKLAATPPVDTDNPNWIVDAYKRGYTYHTCLACQTRSWFQRRGDKIKCLSCDSIFNERAFERAMGRKRSLKLRSYERSAVHKVVSPESYKARMLRIYGQKVDI